MVTKKTNDDERPKKPMHFRVTEDEHAMVTRLAKDEGRSVVQFFRRMIRVRWEATYGTADPKVTAGRGR